ncbi:PilW family protein [Halomonas sp. 1390]|uniref:PilW family protein n=1 Tax=Halomonas sp. B23F22_3 TaxID=3459516 RepID=UPI00373EB9D9
MKMKIVCYYQRGFSLVELMIALVIGLLVVFGATQIFTSGKRSYEQASLLNQRQETLRYLVDVMAQDIRTADPLSAASSDGSSLTLDYSESRESDAYCSGDDLDQLVYSQQNGSLDLEVSCIDAGGAVTTVEQSIINGIVDASFNLSLDSGVVNNKVYVDIGLSLVPIDGQPDAFTFRVTNRASAVSRFE